MASLTNRLDVGCRQRTRCPLGRAHPDELAAIEARLALIWRRALDVPSVAATDNFFDIGGNSLLAIRLFTDVEAVFGVRLPLSALFRSGTIQALACLLATDASAEDETPIVPIQPLGTRAPFFLVHGIGGEVLSFQALARHLGADQPTYGLRAVGYDDARDSRIEDVAAHYVEALLRVAPGGPLSAWAATRRVVSSPTRWRSSCTTPDTRWRCWRCSMRPRRELKPPPLTPATIWRLVRNAAYWPLDDEFFRSDWTAQRARVGAKIRAIQARRAHGSGTTTALAAGADVRDLLGLWHMPAACAGVFRAICANDAGLPAAPVPGEGHRLSCADAQTGLPRHARSRVAQARPRRCGRARRPRFSRHYPRRASRARRWPPRSAKVCGHPELPFILGDLRAAKRGATCAPIRRLAVRGTAPSESARTRRRGSRAVRSSSARAGRRGRPGSTSSARAPAATSS